MVMRMIATLIESLLATGILCAQSATTPKDAGFDEPVKTTVVDLGPSPFYGNNERIRKKLTCFYYPEFIVKEYDEGEKGAEWLSIVSGTNAACTLDHGEGERVIEPNEWSGYFGGAKGHYVILSAADGEDGGMPFAIFDARSGNRRFGDAFLLPATGKRLGVPTSFRVSSGTEESPEITYFRVVRAGCNLKADPSGCWKKVRSEFGVRQTDIPVCTGYEKANWESAVVYRVNVRLTDVPQMTAVDGPVFCWPTD